MLDIATRSIFAAEPEEISLLHFLFYCHSGGGLMRLSRIERGTQAERVVGGMAQVCERLATPLGSQLVLQMPVRAVRQSDRGVEVEAGGTVWTAPFAILAIPPALAAQVSFSPALPLARVAVHTRMPMGKVIKCVAAYPRAFWREAGHSGEAFSDTGPVGLAFDDTGHDDLHPALVAFLLGQSAATWTGRPAAERRAAVLGHLVTLFGSRAGSPTAYAELDWPADAWSRGCYGAVPPPGVLTEGASALRTPWDRVHWAGTETAIENCGYIDGAVEAGERAAGEILSLFESTRGAGSPLARRSSGAENLAAS